MNATVSMSDKNSRGLQGRRAALVMMGLIFAAGCPGGKPVTAHDRKQAVYLASEAQFALSIREWARAEGLLEKAVKADPQGDYWLSLGATRVRLNKRAAAKDAYQAAVKAFELETARNNKEPAGWLKQAYVLALLGRKDDSRAVLARAARLFPNDSNVRAMSDSQGFEKMTSTPAFKDMALQ